MSVTPAWEEVAEPSSPPALLQQLQFRRLSYSRFLSRVPQNAINLALVLLVLDATGKAFFTSLLVLALVVPMMIAGIVAGVAADAIPRRLIVALGNVGRAAVCVGFIVQPGGDGTLYVVAVLLAVFAPFVAAAEGSILPSIVTRGELARANAIGQAVGGAAQIVGFAVLTPVVLRVFERADVLFGIAAAFFVIAAVEAVRIGPVARTREEADVFAAADPSGLAVIPDPTDPASQEGASWWQAGWRAMRRDPAVFKAAIELTLITMMLIILGGLIPTYIRDVLELPFEIGALVLTPAGIGLVVGLRVAGPLAHRVPHGLLSSFGFTLFTGLLLALAFVNEEASFLAGYGAFAWLNDVNLGDFDGGALLAMAVVLPLGFAFAIVSVAAQTVLNDRVPLALQGRVVATQGAMAALAASLPVLGAGALGDWLGVQPVMAILAVSIAAATVINLRS
ncbi:MAG: MFS transporter [Chloroflexi bacterium]|nr:MFS transporter [Chloroflexota bacterium]